MGPGVACGCLNDVAVTPQLSVGLQTWSWGEADNCLRPSDLTLPPGEAEEGIVVAFTESQGIAMRGSTAQVPPWLLEQHPPLHLPNACLVWLNHPLTTRVLLEQRE